MGGRAHRKLLFCGPYRVHQAEFVLILNNHAIDRIISTSFLDPFGFFQIFHSIFGSQESFENDPEQYGFVLSEHELISRHMHPFQIKFRIFHKMNIQKLLPQYLSELEISR